MLYIASTFPAFSVVSVLERDIINTCTVELLKCVQAEGGGLRLQMRFKLIRDILFLCELLIRNCFNVKNMLMMIIIIIIIIIVVSIVTKTANEARSISKVA
jgi:hypothetical protein